MGAAHANAAAALPALFGVMVGIVVYLGGWMWWIGLAVVIAGLWWIVGAGERMLATHPHRARWMIECSYLLALGVTALGTLVVAVVVLRVPLSVFGDLTGLQEKEVSQLSSAFAGAVSAYVAIVWTKDIGDAKGAFWPGTRFQVGMEQVYARLRVTPATGHPVIDALSSSIVPGHGDLGWGFAARGVRAGILAAYLAAQPSVPPADTLPGS
jgi:hypothetical protein